MGAAAAQARGVQRPLFLTGMMGCGKTTVGRLVAESLQVPFVDLDVRIERLFGASVPELLAADPAAFREREREALSSLLAEPGVAGRGLVVATGGGAILDSRSRAAMDEVGTRVYLEVSVEELEQRLARAQAHGEGARPLLRGGASLRSRVAELLTARRSHYRSAAVSIDAQGPPEGVAERILAALGAPTGSRDSEAV